MISRVQTPVGKLHIKLNNFYISREGEYILTPIEYYLIRSLMYRKYEKKRRKLQKKRYKKAKRQYNRELMRESADRQTEWIQEQIQKHKEKKEEKRNREVTDYGYDLPSSYEYVNENEPETSSASSFRFFSDDFATYILNHWDREFDIVHFLFPIVSVIMLVIFVPISRFAELDGVRVTTGAWLIYDLLFFVLWIIPFDIIVFIVKKLSVLYVKSHYLEFEEETDEEVEQDIADDIEIHSDNIPYAEESDFEDDAFTVGKRSNVTPEKKQENHIPKIIPKKKKAPFNVEAFAKECNAYVVKQERQEEQENLQH